MIVVEGPDGSGKTTLIQQLVDRTGLPVAPRVVSKDAEAMVDLQEWVELNLEKGWQNTIFDRHRLISEPIYGPILRREPEPGFDDPEWFYVQLDTFYALDPIVVYCLPPFKVVWENVLASEDNKIFHGSPQQVRMIWGAYFNKAHTEQALRSADTWVYDYTQPRTAEMLLHTLTYLVNARVRKTL